MVNDTNAIESTLLKIFDYISNNIERCIAIFNVGGLDYIDKIAEVNKQILSPTSYHSDQLKATSITYAYYGVIRLWYQTGMKETPDEMVHLILNMWN